MDPHLRRTFWLVVLVATALVASAGHGPLSAHSAADPVPARLTDLEFWRLITEFSEPNGTFQSDNLVSNELGFPYVIEELVSRTPRDGVYLGVGPEQNFSYIVAIRPKAAFIVDVRRGNLQLHLLYKALFELSKDRAAFVARLFGRQVPSRLGPSATAASLFQALEASTLVRPGDKALNATVDAVFEVLIKRHHLPLPKEDLAGIRECLSKFYLFGSAITYSSTARTWSPMPSYAQLMGATDGRRELSFLAGEDRFKIVKDLEERNLVIPLVGNFAGPKALRAAGQYIRDHDAAVTAMYVSNVEQYLLHDNSWGAFCMNVASMPLDRQSTFIRSAGVSAASAGMSGLIPYLAPMVDETRTCVK
jgi:hypothetical protein